MFRLGVVRIVAVVALLVATGACAFRPVVWPSPAERPRVARHAVPQAVASLVEGGR